MLALFAAATLTAAPPAEQALAGPRLIAPASPLIQSRACALWEANPVRRDAPGSGPRALGEEPRADLELTVLRLDENGCSVPVVVRRNASGDGRFASPGR